jgi:hypothetical protein
MITARTNSTCGRCGGAIAPGDRIEKVEEKNGRWSKSYGKWLRRARRYWRHIDCMVGQPCPLCDGRLIAGSKAWGCDRWSSGCGYRVPFIDKNPLRTLWWHKI